MSTSLLDESETLPSTPPIENGQDVSVTIYEPPTGWQLINVCELWKFRELLFFFTWRDVKVRYKQTMLGALWAIIQPFMMMIVFTIFLGKMANIDSGDLPYPVFVYAGLLPWTFFATAITNAGNSVVSSSSIITKVYFPRLIVPFSSVGAAIVDFGIALIMLGVLMVYFQVSLTWQFLLLPIPFLFSMLAAIGVGTTLAALNVSYRDFRYTIPFLVQLWLFATPTVYMNLEELESQDETAIQNIQQNGDATSAEESASNPYTETAIQFLINANPMTGVVGFFRAATLGGPLPWLRLAYSSVSIVIVFFLGLFYFRRVESRFSDII